MINANVRSFAAGRVGQQVGRGECFDLADRALRAAGARSAADYGEVTATADYVWGQSIQASQAMAGDIIQFRNYQMTIVTITVVRNADGSGRTDQEEEVRSRPHHTGIVDSTSSSEGMSVLEQNATGDRRVSRNRLHFSSRTIGPRVTRSGGTTTTVTRRITVTGQVWFYRPEAR